MSQTKATPEEKNACKEIFDRKKSAAEACGIVRVDKTSFRTRIPLYQQEGSLGLFKDGTS